MSSWIVCRKPNPAARVRLFCFPYAGGGASVYRDWGAELPSSVEVCAVQLPGREMRLREPAYTRMDPALEGIAAALAGRLDRPFVLFGYSLGALFGFEFARLLRRRQLPAPMHLFAAARVPPHVRRDEPPLAGLSDPELVAAVNRRYEGIPQAVLREPELLQLLLPIVRADLTLMESYVHCFEEPLGIPLSVFGGADDPVARPEEIEGWRQHTSGTFKSRILPGRHFFLNTARGEMLRAIVEDLGEHL